MTEKWPRGSEWRKWDLQLHPPAAKLNDGYGGDRSEVWDEYCRLLHESDVAAFGITDYFSFDGYENTVREYKSRYPDCTKVFFPNVELRTSYVVNSAQEEVHLHIILNPFRANCAGEAKKFIQCLNTNKTEGPDLDVKAAELGSKEDYQAATTDMKHIRDALNETFGRQADWLECALVITAANNDGIRPIRGASRKALITDELDKFSHGFFGNKGNVEYFLKNDRSEDKSVHTKPKPVLAYSDAHSFRDLAQRLGRVFTTDEGAILDPCWVKGDVTFEGLKQIFFEPENRVFIGAEPNIETRVRNNKRHYIDRLKLSCVDGYQNQHGIWFRDEEILLGKELVAIIGNKGSGKSAVTDVIGLLGNTHNQFGDLAGTRPEELFSFLNSKKFHKGGCSSNFKGELHWHEGAPDIKSLDEKVDPSVPEKVEYLPQKYLERVCANIEDDEFRTTLNQVIFRYVKEKDRFGKENLEDLLDYRRQQDDEEIEDARRRLHQANEKVVEVERRLVPEYRAGVEEKLRQKHEELEAHVGVKPTLMEKPEEADGDSPSQEEIEIANLDTDIEKKALQLTELGNEQVSISQATESLKQARQAIERGIANLQALETTHSASLREAGLAFDSIVKVETDYEPLDEEIAKRKERLQDISSLLATEQDIAIRYSGLTGNDGAAAMEAGKAASIFCQKEAAEKQRQTLVEKLTQPEREYQDYLKVLKAWEVRLTEIRGREGDPKADSLLGLQQELSRIDNEYAGQLNGVRAERNELSKEIFEKKRELVRFYNDVKKAIDSQLAKCRDDLGDYDISIDAGLRLNQVFYAEFLRFINQGKRGSFHGTEEGLAMLRALCESVIEWDDEEQVFSALEEILDALHFDRRFDQGDGKREPRSIFEQLKNQRSVAELYDFLFGFEYLQTKYDLRIDQKDLSELSPGERGGLLLIFYLMLDRQDIPLVIDQPEDNLDNQSVYTILATFIKIAKARRQIILVTHNPNLAVAADAEQIIRVSINKKGNMHDFDFMSGSIEDPEINRAVVDILEGTLPAFDNRRLKYRRKV